MSVQTRPSHVMRGLGDILINYALTVAKATPGPCDLRPVHDSRRLDHAAVLAGVHAVAAVTRCRSWVDAHIRDPQLTMTEYIQSRTDPGLNFHTGRGAEVVAILEGWRNEDVANDGCGIIVRYDLRQFRLVSDAGWAPGAQRTPLTSTLSSETPRTDEPPGDEPLAECPPACPQQRVSTARERELTEMAISLTRQLTNSSKADADSPLMEAGLDSLLMPEFTTVRRAIASARLFA